MKRFLLVLSLTLFAGCGDMVPPKDIQQAITLIRSATEDISKHNLDLSRERLGELIAALERETSRVSGDLDAIRELKIKIALEQENIQALKDLPPTMEDLEAWSLGE